MSHQTGISVSDELRNAFGDAAADTSDAPAVRLLVARIVDERIVETARAAPVGDWHADLALVPSLLTDCDAAYVLYRAERAWLLMAHVPDKCKVKDKMVYAATRATLKQQLGSASFPEEMHGTLPEDFGVAGYDAWRAHRDADDPLTRAEIQKAEEVEQGEIYRGGASTYVHGVAFDTDAGVMDALGGLVSGAGGNNYVALGVDTERERITLAAAKSVTIDALGAEVPGDEPRFHFYRYVRTLRGTAYDELVFIYTCPDGSEGTTACPIKQRMLYSSSKARVVALLEQCGGAAAKTFEFNAGSEVNAADIDNAMHPPPAAAKASFARPKRPGSGGRRLVKAGRAQ